MHFFFFTLQNLTAEKAVLQAQCITLTLPSLYDYIWLSVTIIVLFFVLKLYSQDIFVGHI